MKDVNTNEISRLIAETERELDHGRERIAHNPMGTADDLNNLEIQSRAYVQARRDLLFAYGVAATVAIANALPGIEDRLSELVSRS